MSAVSNQCGNALDAKTPVISYFLLVLIIAISLLTIPKDVADGEVTWQHVWYYGWITGNFMFLN